MPFLSNPDRKHSCPHCLYYQHEGKNKANLAVSEAHMVSTANFFLVKQFRIGALHGETEHLGCFTFSALVNSIRLSSLSINY